MKKMRCSGCRKCQHEIRQMIALRKGFICNECIAECVNILIGRKLDTTPPERAA